MCVEQMITLNENGEITYVQSWEDVISMPGFRQKVDPKEIKLTAIRGVYQFEEKVHCGLTCNQPHNKGYIVQGESGVTTNVGNVCGKNHFGVDFTAMTSRFDRDLRDKENRNEIRKFKARSASFGQEVEALREAGATYIQRHALLLIQKGRGVPDAVTDWFVNAVRTGDRKVYKDREATEEEHELLELEQDRRLTRPQYMKDAVATVEGVEFLSPGNDLKTLLVDEVETMMAWVVDLDEDQATPEELARASKWVRDADNKLQSAREALALGKRLLQGNNLNPLMLLLDSNEEKKLFKRFLRDVHEARKKVG